MCEKYQDEVDRFDDKMREVSAREVYRMEKQEQAEQDIFKTAGRSHDYFVGKAANQEVKERAACPIYRDELEIAKRALLLEQKENRQNRAPQRARSSKPNIQAPPMKSLAFAG